MLLCCGADGLLEWHETWRPVSCPLPSPALITTDGRRRAVLDNTEHLLWLEDQLHPVDSGIECLLMWRGHPLLLSGDTDCLTLMHPSTGDPLFLTPAGVYPQDMCLLPGDAVAVCGGGSGTVLLFHLPELQLLRSIRVPGNAQRIVFCSGWLYVLCAAEDDGLRCLLCRADPRSSRYEPLFSAPGLSGSLLAYNRSLWVAASESLYRFLPGERKPLQTFGGFGLIRHMLGNREQLFLSDPVLGTLFLLKPGRPPLPLLEGDVGQTALTIT